VYGQRISNFRSVASFNDVGRISSEQ